MFQSKSTVFIEVFADEISGQISVLQNVSKPGAAVRGFRPTIRALAKEAIREICASVM